MELLLVADSVQLLFTLGSLVALLMSVALRDACFAAAAARLGDDSARRSGRMTWVPWAHLDVFRTVLVPVVLLLTTGLTFGCGRHLPLDPRSLRRPNRDIFLVALAGPLANLTLALLLGISIVLLSRFDLIRPENLGYALLMQAGWTNTLLCIVHLIPLPPLDASRLMAKFLPDRHRRSFESIGIYGLLLLLSVLFTPLGLVVQQETETLPVWFRFVAQMIIP